MTGNPSAAAAAAQSLEDYLEQAHAALPPVVYVPVSGRSSELLHEVEMRETTDGRRALLVYTALDRLADCCGPHQAWILVETRRLDELGQDQPFDVVYFDMPIPAELQKQAPVEDADV